MAASLTNGDFPPHYSDVFPSKGDVLATFLAASAMKGDVDIVDCGVVDVDLMCLHLSHALSVPSVVSIHQVLTC